MYKRQIFDISDTGGKNVKLTWDLEGENLKDYVDFLVSEGQIEQYDNSDRDKPFIDNHIYLHLPVHIYVQWLVQIIGI